MELEVGRIVIRRPERSHTVPPKEGECWREVRGKSQDWQEKSQGGNWVRWEGEGGGSPGEASAGLGDAFSVLSFSPCRTGASERAKGKVGWEGLRHLRPRLA